MAQRAAIVTGASSGIGLAIARMLGTEGHALTMAARRPEKLARAAEALRRQGLDVHDVPANLTREDDALRLVDEHRARFGRLDVLVNNAGVGIAGSIEGYPSKWIDMQLQLNLRSIIVLYRECVGLLRAAGSEHRNALVVNTASIAGKSGQAGLSIYSATKAAIIAFTQAMNRELAEQGVKSCALCPAFVDTEMTEFAKEQIPSHEMIQSDDVAECVRLLLRLSPACIVPELILQRPNEGF